MKLYKCIIENSTGIKKGESDSDKYFIGVDSGVIVRIKGSDVEILHVSNLGGDGLSRVHLLNDRKVYDIAELLPSEPVKVQEVKTVEAVVGKKQGRPKIYP